MKQWEFDLFPLLWATCAVVLLSLSASVYLYRTLTAEVTFWRLSATSPKVHAEVTQDPISHEALAQMAARVGNLQAKINRLEAFAAALDNEYHLEDQFEFDVLPPMGGPSHEPDDEIIDSEQLEAMLDQLDRAASQQDHFLSQADALLRLEQLIGQTHISGMPIDGEGYLSSPFGRRNDPFTGQVRWHKGVDIAAKSGTSIVATGAGVVTAAEYRNAYGYLVEVDHGNGYVTRYAHAKSLTVSVGDFVSKGDTVALIGNTGRSTGAHVHYEVLKDGRALNPHSYIKQ